MCLSSHPTFTLWGRHWTCSEPSLPSVTDIYALSAWGLKWTHWSCIQAGDLFSCPSCLPLKSLHSHPHPCSSMFAGAYPPTIPPFPGDSTKPWCEQRLPHFCGLSLHSPPPSISIPLFIPLMAQNNFYLGHLVPDLAGTWVSYSHYPSCSPL